MSISSARQVYTMIYVSSQHVLDSSDNTPVIESGIGTRQTMCRRALVETVKHL
jgi:hypothetical protein